MVALYRRTQSGNLAESSYIEDSFSARSVIERVKYQKARMGLGVFLVLFSLLAGWLLVEGRGETVSVWATVREVPAGHALSIQDLVKEYVPSDAQLQAISGQQQLLGRYTRLAIPKGSLIFEGHLISVGDVFERPNRATVGVSVPRGRVPQEISTGDKVILVQWRRTVEQQTHTSHIDVGEINVSNVAFTASDELSATSSSTSSAANTTKPSNKDEVVVRSVSRNESHSELLITLDVPLTKAAEIAKLASNGDIALVVTGRS